MEINLILKTSLSALVLVQLRAQPHALGTFRLRCLSPRCVCVHVRVCACTCACMRMCVCMCVCALRGQRKEEHWLWCRPLGRHPERRKQPSLLPLYVFQQAGCGIRWSQQVEGAATAG